MDGTAIAIKTNNEGSIPLKVLEQICQSVNKSSLRRTESYKQAEAFLRRIGFKYCEVQYEATYLYKEDLIDLYSYLNGRVAIYIKNDIVLGCKVHNPPYTFRKHMEHVLSGYSVLETADCVSYEYIS